MKKTLLLLCLFFVACCAHAQLLSWQFGSPASNGDEVSFAPTYTNPHLTGSPLVRGNGLLVSGFVRGFSAIDFTLNGAKADAVANNDYFQTSFTVGTGYTASVYNIDAHIRRSSTAAANAYRWMYSLDGTNFTEIGTADVAFTTTTADGDDQVSIIVSGMAALQNLPANTTVIFRLYLWGATTTTSAISFGRFAADNTAPSLSIGGRVKPLNASSLLAWQFGSPASLGSETTYSPTFTAGNVATSLLSRGPGIPAASATSLARGFTAANFLPLSSVKTDAITNGNYYQFTIAASTGMLSLSTLDARLRRSAAGSSAYRWMYSLDGTNFTALDTADASLMSTYDGVDQPQLDLSSVAALQNVPAATTVTFRLYSWGSTTSTGTFAIGRFISGATNNSLEIQGTVAVPTPLNLLSFEAAKTQNNIALSWTTVNEVNTDHFVVERGTTAQQFEEIGTVAAKNTAGQNEYAYTDKLNEATVYYRLRMFDKDGSYTYSKVIAVTAGNNKAVAVYPNPVINTCTMQHGTAGANALVLVVDINGKILVEQPVASGQAATILNLGSLVKGSYWVSFINNGEKQTTAIQKL